MKPKTTICLIAVLLVCAALVVVRRAGWFSRGGGADGSDGRGKKLFADAPAKAVSLSVKSAGGATTVFRKVDGKWRLVEPVDAPADKYRVEGIADMFGNLKIRRLVGSGDEEAAADVTGLDNPRWTVALTGDDGAVSTMAVGRDLPRIGSSRAAAYVRASGRREVCVVAEDFAEKLRRPVSYFRSKTVLELDKDRIVRLTVWGNENYRLAKRDGKWGIERPVSARADEDEVAALLGRFMKLNADEFVADDPASLAPYGLDKPSLVVTLEVKAKEANGGASSEPTSAPAKAKANKYYSLSLGRTVGKGKKVFARLSGEKSVFTLDEKMLTDLQPRLIELRDKTVLPVAAGDVSRIELDMPAGKASLVRQGGKWRMTFPVKGPAGDEAVSRLLKDVGSLKADDFLDSAGAVASGGLTAPSGRITLHLAGGGRAISLLIGSTSPSGEKTFVTARGGGGAGEEEKTSVAVVSTSDVQPLLVAPASLWNPTLLELDSQNGEGEKVTHLSVSRPGQAAVKLALDKVGKWRLSSPIEADADKTNVDALLDRLDKLTATKVVAIGPGKAVPDKYAGAASRVTLDFTTSTLVATQPTSDLASQPASAPKPISTVTKKYRIHVVKVGGHSYAWVQGRKVVAVGQFAADLYDVVTAELRDRTVWNIVADDVSRISITTPRGVVELRRDGKRWIYVADPLVKIDAKKVTDYLNAVKELRADRFVSYKSAGAGRFAPDTPAVTVKLVVGDKTKQIIISPPPRGPAGSKNRYAAVAGLEGVFLLPADKLAALAKALDDFKK